MFLLAHIFATMVSCVHALSPPYFTPNYTVSVVSMPDGPNPCTNLTAGLVSLATTQAGGTKRFFFEKLRKEAPTALTSKPYTSSGVQLGSASMRGALFFGDSIVREISDAFPKITKSTNGKSLPMLFRWAPGGLGLQEDDHGLSAYRNAIMMARNESGVPYSVVFVGGLGIHHLVPKAPCLERNGPTLGHEKLIEQVLTALGKLAFELEVPIVFVGVMAIDGATILLDPPKHDWAKFRDFSLPYIWDGVEAKVFAGIQNSSNEFKNIDSISVEENPKKKFPGLYHFRPTALALQCPGVRCDGMHFGSGWARGRGSGYLANIDFDCTSSEALWHRPLAEFFLRNFGEKPVRAKHDVDCASPRRMPRRCPRAATRR